MVAATIFRVACTTSDEAEECDESDNAAPWSPLRIAWLQTAHLGSVRRRQLNLEPLVVEQRSDALLDASYVPAINRHQQPLLPPLESSHHAHLVKVNVFLHLTPQFSCHGAQNRQVDPYPLSGVQEEHKTVVTCADLGATSRLTSSCINWILQPPLYSMH
jgi:hypothetical protein